MADTPESRTEAETGAPRVVGRDDRYDRPSPLSRIAVWVAIVAGVVFIVAVIFFSGLFIGWANGHHHYGHWRYHNPDSQMGSGNQSGPGNQMGPGCMMGPGMMGPGGSSPTTTPPMGPGQMGPGQMGPGQMGPGAMTTTPTTARPR